MSTTPGAGRDRPGSSTAPPGNNAKKKKAGAALDPTHHQRGCHPERRSNPSAPRQGIKRGQPENRERELDKIRPIRLQVRPRDHWTKTPGKPSEETYECTLY